MATFEEDNLDLSEWGRIESSVSNPPTDAEKVLSGLEVEAFLKFGSEHLFLLFTQTRVILAHHSKTGRGSVPLYSIFGKMSEGFKRASDKCKVLQKMADMTPMQILRLRADNFSIEYQRIVSMTVELEDRRRSKITLVTGDQKLELYASQVAAEGVRESVQSLLPGKTEYKLRT